MHLFNAPVYTNRRTRLAQDVKEGLILIQGNDNSPINYADNYYPFRQDSNFLYFAGIDLPHLNLVIDTASGNSTLYGDEMELSDVIWTGPQASLVELAEKVGINAVKPANALYADCSGKQIHCLPPYRAEHFKSLQAVTDSCNCSTSPSRQLINAVISQREIKSDEEVAQIELALEISKQMHVKAMQAVTPGMTEAMLAGIAEGIALSNDSHLAYGMILTRNGHILHNHAHHNPLASGDLVLGDFGAESPMRYASDITRTFPVNGKFTQRQAEIYNIVLEAEVKCINASRVGQSYKDVHLLAARIITDGLGALGVMKGDPEEAVQAGAHTLFFPHGLGHMMGLDVHDMEGLGEDLVGYDETVQRSEQFGTAYLRLGKKLEAGNVLTVEPGLYFIPPLIDAWSSENKHAEFINYDKVNEYRDFTGVRIEDDILITDDGPKVLGSPIPKTIAEIEGRR